MNGRISSWMFGLALLVLTAACGGGGGGGGATGGVLPKDPAIASFTATPSRVSKGDKVELSAIFSGDHQASVDNGVGVIKSGTPVSAAVTEDTTFTLSVIGLDGATATAKAVVTVSAAPTGQLTPAATQVPYGGRTDITPVFSGATGVVDQGIGSVTSGVPFTTGPIAVPTTFTLTLTAPGGATATATATITPGIVTVQPPSPVPANGITVGHSMTFVAVALGATDQSVTWTASAGSMDPATGKWTAPLVPGTCTITATSVANPAISASITVTVFAAPIIRYFVVG